MEETRGVDELSFGEGLQELEGVVAALEGGQLELEESLAKYERGVVLLRALQTRLAEAQQKVTALIGELEAETAEADALTARTDAADSESSSGSEPA